MDWHKLFTEYSVIVSSVTTIFTSIVLVVGYFIKRKYDLKSKKTEINHNLFQKDKLSAVQSFFFQTSQTEAMWHSFNFYKVLDDASNDGTLENMLDEKIWGSHYNLKHSILNVRIFFDEAEFKYFEEVYENFNKINRIVSSFHIKPKHSFTNSEAAYIYNDVLDKAKNNNKILLNKIASIMSDSYHK